MTTASPPIRSVAPRCPDVVRLVSSRALGLRGSVARCDRALGACTARPVALIHVGPRRSYRSHIAVCNAACDGRRTGGSPLVDRLRTVRACPTRTLAADDRARRTARPPAPPASATRPTPGPGSRAARRARVQLSPADGAADPRSSSPRPGSARWPSRRPGPTSGSARTRRGHLQATGRDARGRKQYRYHARWRTGARRRQVRAHASPSPRVLPRIRRRCDARPAHAGPAAREGPGRGRPAARADPHPGRQRRVRPAQPLVRPDDPARAATPASTGTRGPLPLPRQVRPPARGRPARPPAGQRRPALPGPARPGAVPVRRRRRRAADVASDDVNDYLREISGADITAKDFRTWAGTVLAYRALRALAPGDGRPRRRERNVVEAVRLTARSARQHAGRRPPELRPPGRPRGLPGRLDRRRAARGGRGADRSARRARAGPRSGQVVALLRKRLRDSRRGRTQESRKAAGSRRHGRKWRRRGIDDGHDPRIDSDRGGTRLMCMNCGCGEPEKRHQPTDITREDLQRAADGTGMTLREAAENVQRASAAAQGCAAGGADGWSHQLICPANQRDARPEIRSGASRVG